ncbi:polysaccharide pyruvyl transferase family protein [Salinarimonas sp.]|uniref:polysaccharide pyruvyl transferase family protein n=1 Tax=Salinarimonas sp. TaxID=2766526 RepID=UPI0032D8E6C8
MSIVGFLGTSGFVPEPERFTLEDRMKAVGANSGNLMFQLAASRIIGGEQRHIGFANRSYGDAQAYKGLTHFVFPAANHLRLGSDWTLLVKFLRTIRVPLVVLGLGAQAALGADADRVAAALEADENIAEFVAVVREKAALVSVRGEFSAQVCRRLGLERVIATGCPSLMLNASPRVGATAARALADPATLAQGPFAVTAANPRELSGITERIERRLFAWLAERDGLYVQQSGPTPLMSTSGSDGLAADPDELRAAHRALAPDMRPDLFGYAFGRSTRLYFDARTWIGDLERCKFALGARLHGNMAALAAGVPGIVVPVDSRTDELADCMCLARLAADDLLEAGSLEDALQRVRFDGAAYDASRRAKAAELVAAFESIGLAPSQHLLGLARGTSDRAVSPTSAEGGESHAAL